MSNQKKTHTLITFLGKDTNTPTIYGDENSYRTTKYLWHELFSDPEFAEETLALSKIDKVILLGTTKSAWNMLYELEEQRTGQYQTEISQLRHALQTGKEQELPENFSSFLQEKNWHGQIIPNGKDLPEQISILEIIDKLDIEDGSTVSIDVTHGLRHLPILGVIIALYLKQKRKVDIQHIFYGAKDLTDDNGITPVINLKGLLEITKWIGALQTFDKDGDYGVFSELLKKDGLTDDAEKSLQQAAFSERVLHLNGVSGAKEHIKKVYGLLADDQLQGISGLFKDQLQERLSWINTEGENERLTLFEHQKALANIYLQKGNYLQSVIFGLEAVITKNCETSEDFHTYDYRSGGEGVLKSLHGDANIDKLTDLRNRLAHASTSDAYRNHLELRFKSETNLLEYIKKIFKDLNLLSNEQPQ